MSTVVPSETTVVGSAAVAQAEQRGGIGTAQRTGAGRQETHGAEQKKKRVISSALVALVLAGIVNAILNASTLWHFDPYAYTYRCWPWWVMHDLRTHHIPHNAALLGSSLMVSAVVGADADYLNRDLDQSQYHEAAYVDHVLTTKFGGNFKTFDLSIPGQMPSDAYMVTKAALDAGQRPDMLIYGIAPRDFIDSTLLSPVDTETYHYLSRVVDVEPLAPKLFKDPLSKLNRFIEKNVYLVGHSLDVQIAGTAALDKIMNAVLPTPPTTHPFLFWDRLKLLPDYKKTEIYPTAMIASPKEQTFSQSRFTDNTKDYIVRYRKPRREIFDMQLFFLAQLNDLCKKNKIKLILINMPITKQNVDILGMPQYKSYWQRIEDFGANQNVSILDLNDFSKYSIEDFHDLVHLNGFGAKKFFDALGDSLATNSQTAAICKQVSQAPVSKSEPRNMFPTPANPSK